MKLYTLTKAQKITMLRAWHAVMNPFKKFKSRSFNFYLYRVLWHYYNNTPRVAKLLLTEYENKSRAG